jgi:hypothetical protein
MPTTPHLLLISSFHVSDQLSFISFYYVSLTFSAISTTTSDLFIPLLILQQNPYDPSERFYDRYRYIICLIFTFLLRYQRDGHSLLILLPSEETEMLKVSSIKIQNTCEETSLYVILYAVFLHVKWYG